MTTRFLLLQNVRVFSDGSNKSSSLAIPFTDHFINYCVIYTDFAEMNRVVSEHERVIETLQLFPLNSFDRESSDQKLRLRGNDQCKETEHPPLDLRLSFL
jgi:hypothetical protein